MIHFTFFVRIALAALLLQFIPSCLLSFGKQERGGVAAQAGKVK